MSNPRAAAHRLVELGFVVLPAEPAGKAPLGRLVPHGWHDATRDSALVERWWRAAPAANVGVACAPSGVVVVDVDPRHGGDDALHDLEHGLGELPASVECLTGGGGRHVYLRDPGGELRAQLAPGVELKRHGYVLAPPSRTTGDYVWVCDQAPGEVETAPVPAPWLDVVRAPARDRPGSGDRPATITGGRADDLEIPMAEGIEALTGRRPNRQNYVRCPFHKGGEERTPSLYVDGPLWTCFGECEAPQGKRYLGGSACTFAAVLWGYPLPLRGPTFLTVQDRLLGALHDHYERSGAA